MGSPSRMLFYRTIAGRRAAFTPRILQADSTGVKLRSFTPLRPGSEVEVVEPRAQGSAESIARVADCRPDPAGLFVIRLAFQPR